MMTFGVLILSDTHLPDAAGLPAAVCELAERADHIVHAGDHSVLDVVTVLEQFAPVTAVRGNVESPELADRLPRTAMVVVAGVRIGVVHDAGPSTGRLERLAGLLPGCDVRVYGHSHLPEITRAADGSWVVNPGSPTQRRRAPFHSVAWMRGDAEGAVSIDLIDIDQVSSISAG